MDAKTKYKLAEAEQQARLDQFQSDIDPSDLTRELALARVMLETALEQGHSVTAKDTLGLIASLSKAHEASLLRKGSLFSAERARRLLESLGAVLADVLKIEFGDGWEIVCDEIQSRWIAKLQEEQNHSRKTAAGLATKRLNAPEK